MKWRGPITRKAVVVALDARPRPSVRLPLSGSFLWINPVEGLELIMVGMAEAVQARTLQQKTYGLAGQEGTKPDEGAGSPA